MENTVSLKMLQAALFAQENCANTIGDLNLAPKQTMIHCCRQVL